MPYPCSLIHSGDKDVGEEEHFLPGYFFGPDTPMPEDLSKQVLDKIKDFDTEYTIYDQLLYRSTFFYW